LSETTVAVGDERAHPELLAKHEGIAVALFGLVSSGRVAT
jgi:hypothetical protein